MHTKSIMPGKMVNGHIYGCIEHRTGLFENIFYSSSGQRKALGSSPTVTCPSVDHWLSFLSWPPFFYGGQESIIHCSPQRTCCGIIPFLQCSSPIVVKLYFDWHICKTTESFFIVMTCKEKNKRKTCPATYRTRSLQTKRVIYGIKMMGWIC